MSTKVVDTLQDILEDSMYKLFESDDFVNPLYELLLNSENVTDELRRFVKDVLPKKITEALPLYSVSIKTVSVTVSSPEFSEKRSLQYKNNNSSTFLLIAAKHDIENEDSINIRKTFVLTSHISFSSINTDVRIGAYLELEDMV